MAKERATLSSLRSIGLRLSRFSSLHIINSLLTNLYAFFQIFAFAHYLERSTYTQSIFVISVSLYLILLNQISGRTLYVAIRGTADYEHQQHLPKVILASFFNVCLLFAIGCIIMMSTGAHIGWVDLGLLCFCILTNHWFHDAQSIFWAVDRGRLFEIISIFRISLLSLDLGILFWLESFAFYVALACFVSVGSLYFALRLAVPFTLRSMRIPLRRYPIQSIIYAYHIRNLTSPALSTLSEFVWMTGPYILFTYRFGVGAELVLCDSVLKVSRLAVSFVRNVLELRLKTQNQLIALGPMASARSFYARSLILCVLIGSISSGVIHSLSGDIFGLIFGRNNVVSIDVIGAASIFVFTSSLFQPVIYLFSFNVLHRYSFYLFVASLSSFAGASLYVCLASQGAIDALQVVAEVFVFNAVLGLLLSLWSISGKRDRDSSVSEASCSAITS